MTNWGPATILTVTLTIIVAITGAVIAALHPETLSFTTYAELLAGLAGANGLTAIGHGILNQPATPTTTTTTVAPPADAPGKVVVTSS